MANWNVPSWDEICVLPVTGEWESIPKLEASAFDLDSLTQKLAILVGMCYLWRWGVQIKQVSHLFIYKLSQNCTRGEGLTWCVPSPIFDALTHLHWLLREKEHVLWLLSNCSPLSVFHRSRKTASGLRQGDGDKPQRNWLGHGSEALRHHGWLCKGATPSLLGEGPFHSVEKDPCPSHWSRGTPNLRALKDRWLSYPIIA